MNYLALAAGGGLLALLLLSSSKPETTVTLKPGHRYRATITFSGSAVAQDVLNAMQPFIGQVKLVSQDSNGLTVEFTAPTIPMPLTIPLATGDWLKIQNVVEL